MDTQNEIAYVSPENADAIVATVTIPTGDFDYTIATQPDYTRIVYVIVTTTTISAGTATIVGTDFDGKTISEDIDITGTPPFYSTNFFKTVTSFTTTGVVGAAPADTISLGYGNFIQLTKGNSTMCSLIVGGNGVTRSYYLIDDDTPATTNTFAFLNNAAGVVAGTYEYDCVCKKGLVFCNIGDDTITITYKK
jgi:hypothetical protein